MNSVVERRVQTRRRELLDRALIWNQRHLLHALREFEDFYNFRRPRQDIADTRPLHLLPMPISGPEQMGGVASFRKSCRMERYWSIITG